MFLQLLILSLLASLALDVELGNFGNEWADTLVDPDRFEEVVPVRRTVPSGVVEELSVSIEGNVRQLPRGFAKAFAGGVSTVKLLEHDASRARFRLRWIDARNEQSAIIELEAKHDEAWRASSYTVRWTRPLAGRFVDVTADLLRDDPGTAAVLALGIDELRERLDPRLGIPLVGHVAGLSAGDLDGDGRTDLLLAQPGGVANRALIAREDGRAVDRAAELGLDVLDATRSSLIADVTGDGANDVLFAMGDSMAGFQRDVDGLYEVALRFPADATTSMAAADVDQDGYLDVYVCGYANPYEGGALPLPYHDANNGVRNVLWKGLGGWGFQDATNSRGLDVNNRRFSFAASFSDVDQDGDPDLYVANDFGRNNLYENLGSDGFRDIAAELGVEDLAAGMGVTFADIDFDGDEDLYVGNMFSSAGHRVSFDPEFRKDSDDAERASFRRHARGNSLYVNEGGFEERAVGLGVDVGWWSWGVRFLDVDTDGAPDIAVPAGMVTREDPDDL